MAVKRRAKRKPVVEDDLAAPGERQRCRLPSWWETTNPQELRKAHARGRQMVDGGVGAISWDDLIGMR